MSTPLEYLTQLVRRPSVNPMGRTDIPAELTLEHRVTDYLEAQLKALGVAYRRTIVAPGRDNLVAQYRAPASSETILWEAHQDTVPVDAMVIDPFAAKVDGGKLYGRGACDVKAGGAVMLAAFARLVREQPPGSASVTLAFTVDEEHTFLGVQQLVKDGVTADFAIIAEPTMGNVVVAHKGVVRWRIETHGRACHSSRPEQGVNAVYRMAKVLNAVEIYAESLRNSTAHPTLGPPTFSVGMIGGGVSPNTVPDRCGIEIDRRLLPGETADGAIAHLDHFLKSRAEIDFAYTVTRNLACPPLNPVPGDHPLLCRFETAIDSVVGKHERHSVPYGTDASTIADAGIPSVVFGPGDIAQAHTKDEWIEVAQLEPAAEILFRFACGKA